MKKLQYIQVIFMFFICCSCSVNNKPAANQSKIKSDTRTTASSTIETNNTAQSLFEYLRRVPGLQVSGSENNPTIIVRNAVSLNQSSIRPLFVINGQPVGNEYAAVAAMVDVNDIKSITLLKDVASTSIYGLRGASGVIEIRTKSGSGR